MAKLSEILKEGHTEYINKLDLPMLMEMVEKVFNAVISEDVASPAGLPDSDEATLEMVLKMIPNIEVSEIGWSDVRTTDEGTEIKGAQRQLLENYLKNIQGANFAAKIRSVSQFYDEGVGMVVEQAGQDRTARIVQAMSYLVFYKTLTKVITNFNAASAGFSFESFLSAMVDGEQIPTGNKTIADYLDRSTGQTIPVSLKLYREGGLLVGGSYTDLVNDMVRPAYPASINGGMRYVACTKQLQGRGLEQEGRIDFYQFDFNLANIGDILANSMYPYVIRMPQIVMNALAAGGPVNAIELLNLPAADSPLSAEELTPLFKAELIKQIESGSQGDPENPIGPIGDEFDNFFKVLDWEKNDALFNKNKTRGGPGKLGVKQVGIWVKNYYNNVPEIHIPLKNAILAADAAVIQSQTSARKKSARNQQIEDMLSGDGFLSPEESARQYKLLGIEQKKQALLTSYGYLKTMHFSLNQTQSTNAGEPTNTQFIGSIMVGRSQVATVVSEIREILNTEVTEIFQSLKILSDSLNQYFAGGLKNDSLAAVSIANADNISSKEILQIDEST